MQHADYQIIIEIDKYFRQDVTKAAFIRITYGKRVV